MGVGMTDLIISLLILILCIICPIILYWKYYARQRSGRQWLSEKGEIVPEVMTKDSVQSFSDPNIERIDLKRFKTDRGYFYRMRVHLRMDSGVSFELSKESNKSGKVYEPGEGKSGIKSVDRRFWVESPDMKTTVKVLNAPKVENTLGRTREIFSVHVMGDEIEIVFGFRNELLDPIYDFVRELAHELMDL